MAGSIAHPGMHADLNPLYAKVPDQLKEDAGLALDRRPLRHGTDRLRDGRGRERTNERTKQRIFRVILSYHSFGILPPLSDNGSPTSCSGPQVVVRPGRSAKPGDVAANVLGIGYADREAMGIDSLIEFARLLSSVESSYKYAKSHEWAKVDGDVATVGISDHAQVGGRSRVNLICMRA